MIVIIIVTTLAICSVLSSYKLINAYVSLSVWHDAFSSITSSLLCPLMGFTLEILVIGAGIFYSVISAARCFQIFSSIYFMRAIGIRFPLKITRYCAYDHCSVNIVSAGFSLCLYKWSHCFSASRY